MQWKRFTVAMNDKDNCGTKSCKLAGSIIAGYSIEKKNSILVEKYCHQVYLEKVEDFFVPPRLTQEIRRVLHKS